MSFLLENNSENLSARITNKGRKKIAQGNFNVSYFQIGDSEFDYNFSEFDGITYPSQKVLMPFDKDSQVKYPYKVSDSTLTGTTYGIPIQFSNTETIKNSMGAAGYVSEYIPYNIGDSTGTIVKSDYTEIDISKINGTNTLIVPIGMIFSNVKFITIYYGTLGLNDVITSDATSVVYQIMSFTSGLTYNTLILDRNMPNFSTLSPKSISVICNEYKPTTTISYEDQQDSWVINTVWSKKPAGLDYPNENESLFGYNSNVYLSTKEYFGYNYSSGQMSNSGTTITNSFGDVIVVPPEDQHSLSIIHFSKIGDILIDPDLVFKYEDYISHSTEEDIEYFEIYIPFIYYDRNIDDTIGARFFMDSTDYFINSSSTDTKINQMKFRYLIDEQGFNVGKIFINHKVIIFDDQEIVATLDYKSNRRYTLPIPRISVLPTDSKCDVNGDILNPLLSGETETVYVSYILSRTGTTYNGSTGLHCNNYVKISGGSINGDISIKFNTSDFKYMNNVTLGHTTGYVANKFQFIIQKVVTGTQPTPSNWKIIDFTSQIPNHTVGTLIDPVNLRNSRFIITDNEYENLSNSYDLEDYLSILPIEPSTLPEFGDEQPFTGSIKLVRATDLEVMKFYVNLPTDDFITTQNPTFPKVTTTKQKRITEVVLLDENKDVIVIAKTSSPIIRTGSQVLSVKIDI